MRRAYCRVLSFFMALCFAPALSFSAQYTITDLGFLSATLPVGYASGINDAGVVAGSGRNGSGLNSLPAIYSGGVVQSLGTFPGGGMATPPGNLPAQATDINNAGQVVGRTNGLFGSPATVNTHAFLYDANQLIDLGVLGGNFSEAYAINDSGVIVGFSSINSGGARHAFSYSGGAMHDLGTLPGEFESRAFAINESGQIAGKSGRLAVLIDNGVMQSIGSGVGWGINDHGDVVGENGVAHAALYHNGTWSDLGTFGGQFSIARDINNLGQIVGNADYPNDDSQPFLYQNGVLYDLRTLIDPASGWDLHNAVAINEFGQITGVGTAPGGGEHVFLLTPVPEPATIYLLLSGAMALAIAQARTRRRNNSRVTHRRS